MLTAHAYLQRSKSAAGQRGVVLLVALIVLVAMTLAGIALVRSVDVANVIAGNLAFQQSATLSGDTGVESAVAWLETTATSSPTSLHNDDATNGYYANGSNASRSPAAGVSWDTFWVNTYTSSNSRQLPLDSTSGNQASYVIDRLCSAAGSPSGGAGCMGSPQVTTATGNEEEAGNIQLNAPSLVYYRITVRIVGPRNTVSYVQAIVAR